MPVDAEVKVRLDGGVWLAVWEVELLELEDVVFVPPSRPIGKREVKGELPFFPLQLTTNKIKSDIILALYLIFFHIFSFSIIYFCSYIIYRYTTNL